MIQIPEVICANWKNVVTNQPARHIYCNRDMAPALLEALQNLRDRGFLGGLKTFDGCFSIRDVRAEPGKPSCHSYGLAIDVNAFENGLDQEPALSSEFVKCFTDVGFTWGGTFHRKDGMHFSYAWE